MIDKASAARRWWVELTDRDHGDRGAVARLRRAPSVMVAATEPATIELFRRFGMTEADTDRLDRVALVAAVLSHVRGDDPRQSMARQIREPVMNRMRFRRLLQAETNGDQLTAFRRAVAMLPNNATNVGDLAESLLNWNEKRRQRWILDYYDPAEASLTNEETNE